MIRVISARTLKDREFETISMCIPYQKGTQSDDRTIQKIHDWILGILSGA